MRETNFVLNHEFFDDYLIERHPMFDGIQYLFKFDNGYGASVVKFEGTYGYEEDLWELAVIEFVESGDYELTYDTPITDVMGHLTDEKVSELLGEIKKLERDTNKEKQ